MRIAVAALLTAVAAASAIVPRAHGAPAVPPPQNPGPQVTPFRTEAPPRVDPVFGDVATLRVAVDDYRTLAAEMRQERDNLSGSINAALVELGALGLAPGPGRKINEAGRARDRRCPPTVEAFYGKAREAGGRYLLLGRRLDARMRELRRADELGDTVGLTPDYRIGVRQARETYLDLLRDLRELRVAFHETLGAELLHAGCTKLGRSATVATRGDTDAEQVDATDPDAWTLGEEERALPVNERPPGHGAAPPGALAPSKSDFASAGAAPAIWIEIDNTRCVRTATLTLDGNVVGEVPARKSTQVRTQAGPHALCVLPTDDKRACGHPGTVRRAYLYEGWTLAVRCDH